MARCQIRNMNEGGDRVARRGRIWRDGACHIPFLEDSSIFHRCGVSCIPTGPGDAAVRPTWFLAGATIAPEMFLIGISGQRWPAVQLWYEKCFSYRQSQNVTCCVLGVLHAFGAAFSIGRTTSQGESSMKSFLLAACLLLMLSSQLCDVQPLSPYEQWGFVLPNVT